MITNLSQLKKAIENKQEFKVIDHWKSENIGQIRKPNIIQTNGFYSIIPNEPNYKLSIANGGEGSWIDYGKASQWEFKDGVCYQYGGKERNMGQFIWAITFEL